MKRFLSILLTLTMLAGMFTFAVSANELGTIAFFNAADNTAVTQLDGVDSVYANVTFAAQKNGTASVMAAHYDIETGVLTKMESIDSVSMTAGVAASFTTSAISVSDTDLLKVFAWDEETIAPLANAGIIERALLEELPTATVTAIDADADFALNFKADDVTDEQLAFYGDWEADFVFTANKAATFNADGTKDGYLIGQYDEFGPEFVKVPATDLAIIAGDPVSIMDAAGFDVTFRDVVETVKDFDCGVNFTDAYLKANDGLEVSLALVIVNPVTGEAYTIAEKAFDFTMPTATVTEIKVADADFALNFKADEATESQVATFGDWKADFVFVTNKDATFNANGTKDGYLIGQYDEFGPEFVKIPPVDFAVTAGTPVNVLETAGMDVTYRDVVETVKDFDCGVNFTDAYLKANDGLEVSLALVIVNPVTGEAYTIAEKSFSWTLPTAEVTHLDTTKLDVEADFAMNFKADEATESQLATYGDWAADYVVTLSKDATFNANGTKDGYLLGQYDEFGAEWVKLPATDLAITAGAPVKVLETAGMSATYRDVVETIKDFDCGINFSKDFLAANDGVSATVELRIYNPLNPNESYVIGDAITRTWKQPTATVTELDVDAIEGVDLTFALNFKADAVTEEQLLMFSDWYADYELTVNKTATFNANGNADGFLSGQYDAWSKNWVSVPFEAATLQANTPVRVMETAAALMGQSGLKLTYADIVNSVKDFNCGLAFTPEFLVANPDLEVTLALKMYNPNNEDESYVIGRVYTFTPETIPSIDKFVGKDITLNHTIETIDGGKVTATLVDLFDAVGPVIQNQDVAVTVDGATVNKVASDWTQTTIDFTTPGTYTVEITDNYYCNVATATVTVVAPEAVDKFIGKAIEVTHTLDTIESNVYTVNFADLFDTNGYAVKDITVTGGTYADGKVTVEGLGTITVTATDNFYCNVATATITVKEPANVDKFTGNTVELTHTLATIEGGVVTATLDELFQNNGYAVKEVTVGGDGTYADGVVSFAGTGTFTVTITDNFYCNEATATVVVNAPVAVDKWVGTTVTYTHTLDTIEANTVTFDFADLFTATGTFPVKEITVTGGTYADGKITVEGIGTFTITANDGFFCNTAIATVIVEEPANVDKFVATNKVIDLTVNTVGKDQNVNFTDLFTAVDGAVLKAVSVTVDGGSFADGVITVPGVAGTYTVTATDNFYCNVATATITVNDAANVDKFTGKAVTYTHTLDTIEANTVTYNFADLFDTNTEYVVKDITVEGATYADGKITVTGIGTFTITATDNFYCNVATATITVKEPANVDKWTGNTVSKKLAYGENTVTATLDELFTNNGYTTKTAVVGGDGTYANSVVTFTGAGTYTVTVTDNFYCNTATATVTVADADPINKFTAKNPAVTHTLASMDAKAVSVKLGDIFGGTNVVTGNITVTIAGKATTVTAADWANATVTIPGETGDVTVTITDNYYCNTATGKVTLTAPANVTKWTATNKTIDLTVNTVGVAQTVNFADLFKAVDGAIIKDVTVTVTGGSYANGVITVPGKAGTYTVTVTDNFYCNPVSATITVNDAANVDKFTGKSVSKKLAYGSNTTTVTLGELFTAGSYTIKDVTVTGGTYAKGATWDKGTVTVTGTGTFTITITDNYYCNAAKATLTVAAADPINKFTAKNPAVTHTLASMDAKAVSVKLGDIFNGTNVVTGNITVTIAGKATTVKDSNWTNATVTIPGTTGDVTVTINDNNTCITATGKVTLKAPANVDKWTTTNKTINLTLANYGTAQSINFADMFTAKSGAYIKTVSVTVNNGGSYANNKITVPGKAGTYTVTVTDNFYCNAATATITVNNPAKVTKWTAKTGLNYEVEAGATQTLKLSDIFTLNNNYKVGTVTYTVEEQGTKTVSGSAWADTQINFPGAGTYTVTITDDLFSDGTYEATVKVTEKVVEPVRKFTVKDDYYLVAHDVVDPGSSNVKTIKLGDIFAASGEGTINSANVTVTTSNKVRKIEATITKNASDWTQTTIALKYSGEITLTITDGSDCVAASAVVATAPKWVGDVDAGDASSIAQAHYGTKTRTYNINVTVQPGKTGTFTLTNIPADGVYGIQWQNGYGIHGTPGTGEFSVNGYSDTSAVTSPKWSDAAGTDFLAYLKAGSNTITVKNVGDQPLAVYGNVNAMSLDKSGYDDEDFLPYLKDNGEGAGGGTVTPPEDTEWPVPEIAWNGKFSGHQYFGDYYGNSIVSPLVNGTYAVGAYTKHTITIPNSGYEGVYVLQFKTSSEAAKIKATTADGYYADFNLTEDGWSSSCAQDQLIYLKKGANTIYVQNVGDASFVLTDIDIGYFDPGYETYYMYDVAQKVNGTIPN